MTDIWYQVITLEQNTKGILCPVKTITRDRRKAEELYAMPHSTWIGESVVGRRHGFKMKNIKTEF